MLDATDVSESIDTRNRGLLVLVGDDVSLLVDGDTSIVDGELLQQRFTTDGPEDSVELCGGVVVVGGVAEGDSLVVGLCEGCDCAVGDDVDTDLGHLIPEGLLDNGVECAENLRGSREDRHL